MKIVLGREKLLFLLFSSSLLFLLVSSFSSLISLFLERKKIFSHLKIDLHNLFSFLWLEKILLFFLFFLFPPFYFFLAFLLSSQLLRISSFSSFWFDVRCSQVTRNKIYSRDFSWGSKVLFCSNSETELSRTLSQNLSEERGRKREEGELTSNVCCFKNFAWTKNSWKKMMRKWWLWKEFHF